MRELVDKYIVSNKEIVKSHIRHNWSQYQPDGKKAALGKYYTPKHLVETVQSLLKPILSVNDDAVVADLAAGCGAFLAAFEDFRIIGRDIDKQAVDVLLEMGFPNVEVANSLKDVSREPLKLGAGDKLIITGNPPYNDATSLNKRYSTDKKDALDMDIDADIKSKDLGVSFMRAFGKLCPDAICVLHPLSYLTKPSNFDRLKEFSRNYKLQNAVVFSSAEFGENIGAKTPFAVVAALYVPGEMAYADIFTFAFPLYEAADGVFCDSGKRLRLNRANTIDGVIRKYPPTKGMPKESDIGIYNYNIRDTNSLITSGAFTEKNDDNAIPIQFSELGNYCYLNCLKRYFGQDFVFGNVSPLYRAEDFSHQWFLDACILDAIMNNQNLPRLNRENKNSFIISKFVLNDAKRRAKSFNIQGMPNFYSAFVDFWENGTPAKTVLAGWMKDYFANLRAEALGGRSDSVDLIAA